MSKPRTTPKRLPPKVWRKLHPLPIRRTPPCRGCGGTTFWDNQPPKTAGRFPIDAPDLVCADEQCRREVFIEPLPGRDDPGPSHKLDRSTSAP